MASFSVSANGTNGCRVTVTGATKGGTYRIYIRRASGTTAVVDTDNTTWSYSATSHVFSYSGLSAGTTYSVNVAIDGTWLGAKTFTTDEETIPEPPTADCWGVTDTYIGNLTSDFSRSYLFSSGQVRRLEMTFSGSGTATFYSTGSYDTMAWLSGSTGFTESTGYPSSFYQKDDDSGSGSNFSISYDVTSGKTYYLYVRLYDISDTGSFTVWIDAPTASWSVSSTSLSTLSSNYSKVYALESYTLKRFTVKFASSGTATFYTTGVLDTMGYLSETTGYSSSTGEPTSCLKSDDEGGDDHNFSFTYPVTAGKTYYFWVRMYSATAAGVPCVCIDVPAVTPTLSNLSVTKSGATITASATVNNAASGYTCRVDFCDTNENPLYQPSITLSSSTTSVSKSYTVTASNTYYVYFYILSGSTYVNSYGPYSVYLSITPSFSTFTVTASSAATPTALVSYAVSNWVSGDQVYIQARQYGTSTWYSKGGPYTSSSINNIAVTLDKAAKYEFRAYVTYSSTNYYSSTVTLDLSGKRPANWEWYSNQGSNPIAKGNKIKLTATEWNDFCKRINQFETYQGKTSTSFTTAVGGTTKIGATICNKARTAVSSLTGHGTLPSKAVAGEPIRASYFNDLRDALNAVP